MANKAIKRERHPVPTIDDLIHTLNEATVFSKLDLFAGYNQLCLLQDAAISLRLPHTTVFGDMFD